MIGPPKRLAFPAEPPKCIGLPQNTQQRLWFPNTPSKCFGPPKNKQTNKQTLGFPFCSHCNQVNQTSGPWEQMAEAVRRWPVARTLGGGPMGAATCRTAPRLRAVSGCQGLPEGGGGVVAPMAEGGDWGWIGLGGGGWRLLLGALVGKTIWCCTTSLCKVPIPSSSGGKPFDGPPEGG